MLIHCTHFEMLKLGGLESYGLYLLLIAKAEVEVNQKWRCYIEVVSAKFQMWHLHFGASP